MNKEIVMEITHSRKDKTKTEFKAVVNKVLVSSLALSVLLGSSGLSAFADDNGKVKVYRNPFKGTCL